MEICNYLSDKQIENLIISLVKSLDTGEGVEEKVIESFLERCTTCFIEGQMIRMAAEGKIQITFRADQNELVFFTGA